jgi:NagD protein
MERRHFLLDMDGVLIKGRTPIPGANDFIDRLNASDREYVVVTNNPVFTPGDLAHRLHAMGLDVPAERLFTSAMATARFLDSQRPRASAFVVGESGLTTAIHGVGYVITDIDPDYVVLGEGKLDTATLTKAVRLIAAGAQFVLTNPDAAGPDEEGIVPAAGAYAAMIETASGRSPYVVGKPNPLMFRTALNYLDIHSEETYMVGDNLRTDIRGGMEAGLETILVLSGVTSEEEIAHSPYRPNHVIRSVADIEL